LSLCFESDTESNPKPTISEFMQKPEFTKITIEKRFEFHLPVPYKRFLKQTIYDNSNFNLEDEIKNNLFSFISQNNISSFIGWDENSILYSIALKCLAFEKKCLLVYFNNENIISKIQPNSNSTKVDWWNSIQFMESDEMCQKFGFQSPEKFLKSANYYNNDLSNRYFYVCELDHENINRYTNIYNSDVTNWFFIFCEEKDILKIISTLSNKEEKPNANSILNLSSSIVNIQIGGDEGYLDYVLIQSKSDISKAIRSIEENQLNFINDYESLLKECKPFDDEWKVDLYMERYLEIIKKYV